MYDGFAISAGGAYRTRILRAGATVAGERRQSCVDLCGLRPRLVDQQPVVASQLLVGLPVVRQDQQRRGGLAQQAEQENPHW